MITIAGVALPESAVWENESSHGNLKQTETPCTDGTLLIHQGGLENTIEIYFPRMAGELTRQTVMQLKAIQKQGNIFSLNINGVTAEAVFHPEEPIALKPLNPRQTHEDNDSYYGRIRLLEV